MSSNLQLQRICQHCGNEFTARTTLTKYCSHKCNSAAYKAIKRASKIEESNKETRIIKAQPIEELKAKEFLTVTQVSKLLGCSRQNVYKLINSGKLRATNILERKTIVMRNEIDKLFKESNEPKPNTESIQAHLNFGELHSVENNLVYDSYYSLIEVQNKYGISEKGLHDLIKRNNIPKIKHGWYAYVPKSIIDKILI